jgi:lactoylglutathione lyase
MKTVLFISALLIIGSLQAQETTSFNFAFDHVALSVKDVDRSAAFCANILRLQEITNRSKLEGVRWFSLGQGKELHLISIIKDAVTLNKAIHVALATSNFDAFVKTLEAHNIAYSDWPGNPQKVNIRADGIKQVFFQDPDGYWYEVNSVVESVGKN